MMERFVVKCTSHYNSRRKRNNVRAW